MTSSSIVEVETMPATSQPAATHLSSPRIAALAAALAVARKKCKPAPKDKKTTGEKYSYDYASSDSVIQAARDALEDSGISLVPIDSFCDGSSKTGEQRYELRTRWLLLHESGESLVLNRTWPIMEDKGRPLDKATPIADTTLLAYLLRDLLMMPRVKLDAKKRITEEQVSHIEKLIAQTGWSKETVQKALTLEKVASVEEFLPDGAATFEKKLMDLLERKAKVPAIAAPANNQAAPAVVK